MTDKEAIEKVDDLITMLKGYITEKPNHVKIPILIEGSCVKYLERVAELAKEYTE